MSATTSATSGPALTTGVMTSDFAVLPNPAVAAIAQNAIATQGTSSGGTCGTMTVGTATPSTVTDVAEKYGGLRCAQPREVLQKIVMLCREQSLLTPISYEDYVNLQIPAQNIRFLKCTGDIDPSMIFATFSHAESLAFEGCSHHHHVKIGCMPNLTHLSFRNLSATSWDLSQPLQDEKPCLPALRHLTVDDCPYFTDATWWAFVSNSGPLDSVSIATRSPETIGVEWLTKIQAHMILHRSIQSLYVSDPKITSICQKGAKLSPAALCQEPEYSFYNQIELMQEQASRNDESQRMKHFFDFSFMLGDS